MQNEYKTVKRLSESKIVLEGIVWTTNSAKAVDIKNPETGGKMISIKVDGIYYYPTGYYGKKSGVLELENETTETE